jgi:predicted RNase H-like HicB family nuclease
MKVPQIFTVTIERKADGDYYVTSSEIPGLHVHHRTLSDVFNMANALDLSFGETAGEPEWGERR